MLNYVVMSQKVHMTSSESVDQRRNSHLYVVGNSGMICLMVAGSGAAVRGFDPRHVRGGVGRADAGGARDHLEELVI
jgi:hypothetical protein